MAESLLIISKELCCLEQISQRLEKGKLRLNTYIPISVELDYHGSKESDAGLGWEKLRLWWLASSGFGDVQQPSVVEGCHGF